MGYPPPPPGQPPVPPQYGGYGGYGQQPPQQWRPPPQIDPSELRPSRLWYWLSPIPAVIGTIVAVLFIVMLVDRIGESPHRFLTGQEITLDFDKGQERGIYAETIGIGSPGASGFATSCNVRDRTNEQTVPLRNPSGTFTLTTGGREYIEQYYFEAPRTGSYVVSCEGPEGTPLAVAAHFGFKGLAYPIIGMVLAFLIGAGLSITILVVTLIKRSNHKKRLQQERMARGY